ncbi:MAG: HEPN domain-containing protein [Defluviitaleaceae bacterium]|nr:HEPN domain-containing protein [Defluviitaleaceae bacterium]
MKKKVTLLDRARADLITAKQMLKNIDDDVFIDIAAYHAQQCVEKIVKFLIGIEGKTYIADHRLSVILEDLADAEAKQLVESLEISIDSWATTARYKTTIAASAKEVAYIIGVCEKLVKIAESRVPQAEPSCKKDVSDRFKRLLEERDQPS